MKKNVFLIILIQFTIFLGCSKSKIYKKPKELVKQDVSCLSEKCHVFKYSFKHAQHGTLEKNKCDLCHIPHDSTNLKNILIKNYLHDRNYAPFKLSNYELCFSCHSKEMVLDQYSTTISDFRNGNKNLHFTHVNNRKGRSCRACHKMHDSYPEKLIKEQRPDGIGYGDYKCEFTKTPTGGRCVVGCHKPRDYDRNDPEPEENWY